MYDVQGVSNSRRSILERGKGENSFSENLEQPQRETLTKKKMKKKTENKKNQMSNRKLKWGLTAIGIVGGGSAVVAIAINHQQKKAAG